MENELVVDKNENPVLVNNRELTFNDFLHGYCNVFALRLKNEYGYKLCNILDENRNLIHSYCVTNTGEFVDIRGKTTNIKMFFEEFDDWLDSGYPFANLVSHEVYELSDTEKEIYTHTQNIIDNYFFMGIDLANKGGSIMTKTLHRGNYQVTISPKGRNVNSKRTFDVFILEFASFKPDYNQRSIASKKCICIGALSELERWFDKEENIANTLNSGAKKFCFELVPLGC